ncbi:MAG TPA: cellulase family glycosylhydrolase [Bdellovibrionales bacterium]|jgi:hypothetical protein|nr:cellulase family glycosylhydrolase [Bdellovibrionales bacterium]
MTKVFLFVAALFFVVASNAGNLPESTFPKMVSVQLKDGDGSELGYSLIDEAGFGMIRKGIYWSTVEKKKGVYDFSFYNGTFSRAAQRGMTVIITLYSNNALYGAGGTPGITTEVGRQGFAKFAAAAVKHYQGMNVIFEIWNEPNLKAFWHTPSNSDAIADEYTALVKAVVPAMRAADPNVYIVAGSISSLWSASFAWFDRCIQQGLLKTDIDGISVHPYGFNWPELSMSGGYAVIRKKLDDAGAKSLRIVNSEVGYDTAWIAKRQGFNEAESLDVQGWMLVRQQMVDLMSNIGISNWYEFREGTIWGVVDKEFDPRPAFDAAKTMTQQLNGYKFNKKLATSSAFDYVLSFKNALGKEKLVVWTTGDNAMPALHRRPTPHDLVIPVSGTGTVGVVNVFGGKGNISAASGKLKVFVEGGPKYLDLSKLVATAPTPTPSPTPTTGLKNVAQGKVVTVSSGSGAAKLVDGNVVSNTSRWMSDSTKPYPQNVVIDLKGSFVISEIRYLQFAARTTDYKIEIWDGKVWKTAATVTGNTALDIKRPIAAMTGSKVRFTVLKGSSYQKVFELQVLGK